jgi:uncharacterized protein
MSASESVAIVLEAFRAVEQRDQARLWEFYHPEVEFHWPPTLPFGGSSHGSVTHGPGPTWSDVWDPLQPTEAERRMDPRVIAATEQEVVVLWRQRGVGPAGDRFDGEVLGLYQVRDGKFARAQMFYFDAVAAQQFLSSAQAHADAQSKQAATHLRSHWAPLLGPLPPVPVSIPPVGEPETGAPVRPTPRWSTKRAR